MKLAIIVAKTDPFYEFVESANTIWAAPNMSAKRV